MATPRRPAPPPPGGDRPDGSPASDREHDPLVRDAAATAGRITGTVAGVTFALLHGVVGYLTVSLGLVAPAWAVATLLVVWGLAAVVGWRLRRRRPIVTMLVPFAVAGLVLAAVSAGGALLGWSA